MRNCLEKNHMKQNEKIVPNSCEKLRNLKRRRGTLCEIVKNKVIYFSQFSYKQFRDALKKTEMWDIVPKGGRVQTGSQIFHIVQMGHRGVGGRGS